MKHFRVIVMLTTTVAGFAACATSNGNLLGTGKGTGGTGAGLTGAGGAAVACPPCLQDSSCATGSLCGQFGGDQYCAPDCSSTPCSEDRTCMAVAGASVYRLAPLTRPRSTICLTEPP